MGAGNDAETAACMFFTSAVASGSSAISLRSAAAWEIGGKDVGELLAATVSPALATVSIESEVRKGKQGRRDRHTGMSLIIVFFGIESTSQDRPSSRDAVENPSAPSW